MDITSAAQHQTSIQPDFDAYKKFSDDQSNAGKVVVTANGHKIQIATQGEKKADSSSYLTKDGIEYHFSDEEKSSIVEHFKKALELKYGAAVDHLFSLTDEAEALTHGLSHGLVKNVLARTNEKESLVRIDQASLLNTKSRDLLEKIDTLDKEAPFFEKMDLLTKTQKHIKNVRTTMQLPNFAKLTDQIKIPIASNLATLISKANEIEKNGFPVSEKAPHRHDTFPTKEIGENEKTLPAQESTKLSPSSVRDLLSF